MEKSIHIADLIVRKLEGSITPPEELELESWLAESPDNAEIFRAVTDPKKQLSKFGIYQLFNGEKVYSALEQQLFPVRRIGILPGKIVRYAAAVLLPVLTAGLLTWYFLKPGNDTMLSEIDQHIHPGSVQGILILSDGSTVDLETEGSVDYILDGSDSIENLKGRLIYGSNEFGQESSGITTFNELRTPTGGSYSVKLADETLVWLNASSTLRFPVNFQDSTRQVFLEGEAYFEVSHTGKPFIVHTEYTDILVLGTSFNVAAYRDTPFESTTLLDGRVRVHTKSGMGDMQEGYLLQPDEQIVLTKNTGQVRKEIVDASGYVSWINGKIEFHNDDLEAVMRTLSRWYGFEYIFQDERAKEYHFSARLDRDAELSTILKMLEMTTEVSFSYKKGVIIIR